MNRGSIKARIAPGIAVSARDEGSVLLRHGLYDVFELDPLGTTIWYALVHGDDFNGILQYVRQIYPDVRAEILEQDLDQFFAELQNYGLLLPEDREAHE